MLFRSHPHRRGGAGPIGVRACHQLPLRHGVRDARGVDRPRAEAPWPPGHQRPGGPGAVGVRPHADRRGAGRHQRISSGRWRWMCRRLCSRSTITVVRDSLSPSRTTWWPSCANNSPTGSASNKTTRLRDNQETCKNSSQGCMSCAWPTQLRSPLWVKHRVLREAYPVVRFSQYTMSNTTTSSIREGVVVSVAC